MLALSGCVYFENRAKTNSGANFFSENMLICFRIPLVATVKSRLLFFDHFSDESPITDTHSGKVSS